MYHPENPTWAPRRARPQQPHAKASKERPAIVTSYSVATGPPAPAFCHTTFKDVGYLLLFLHPSHSHALAPTPHLPNFSIFLCPLLLRAHRMSDNHKHLQQSRSMERARTPERIPASSASATSRSSQAQVQHQADTNLRKTRFISKPKIPNSLTQ